MTVTSNVTGPRVVSWAYRRFTPPIDNTATRIAVERIINASLWQMRHADSGGQGQCRDGERRKPEGMFALDAVDRPGAVRGGKQDACLRATALRGREQHDPATISPSLTPDTLHSPPYELIATARPYAHCAQPRSQCWSSRIG